MGKNVKYEQNTKPQGHDVSLKEIENGSRQYYSLLPCFYTIFKLNVKMRLVSFTFRINRHECQF